VKILYTCQLLGWSHLSGFNLW